MSILDMIGDIPMIKHFSEKDKEEFAKLDHSVQGFNNGDIIIKEGDIYTCLYLLIRGSISIIKTGYSTPLATLKAGSIFGEVSFLTKKPRKNNVIAVDNVLILKMDQSFFDQLPHEINDKIKNYLIELLGERLDAMNKALSKIARFAGISGLP